MIPMNQPTDCSVTLHKNYRDGDRNIEIDIHADITVATGCDFETGPFSHCEINTIEARVQMTVWETGEESPTQTTTDIETIRAAWPGDLEFDLIEEAMQ